MSLIIAWTLAMAYFWVSLGMLSHQASTGPRSRTGYWFTGILTLLLLGLPLASEVCSWLRWYSSAATLHYAASFLVGAAIFGSVLALPATVLVKLLKKKLEKNGRKSRRAIIGTLLLIPFLGGAVIAGYGIWEGRDLGIKRIALESDKIPAKQQRIRIAAIADLHLENPVKFGLLEEMVSKISHQKPDIILALGDIVVGPISNPDRVAGLLAKLKAPWGKFYIYGNHELLPGRNQPIQLLHRAGFKPLINEGITIGGINLIGLSDAGFDDHQGGGLPLLINNGLFTILMEHRPIVSPENAALFDLQLSGHTHGGQVWPVSLLMAVRYPFIKGLYRISQQKWIYTTPGVGTYGPPIRLLSPPEITIIDLFSKQPMPAGVSKP